MICPECGRRPSERYGRKIVAEVASDARWSDPSAEPRTRMVGPCLHACHDQADRAPEAFEALRYVAGVLRRGRVIEEDREEMQRTLAALLSVTPAAPTTAHAPYCRSSYSDAAGAHFDASRCNCGEAPAAQAEGGCGDEGDCAILRCGLCDAPLSLDKEERAAHWRTCVVEPAASEAGAAVVMDDRTALHVRCGQAANRIVLDQRGTMDELDLARGYLQLVERALSAPPSARDELVAECERVLSDVIAANENQTYRGLGEDVEGLAARARALLARLRSGGKAGT